MLAVGSQNALVFGCTCESRAPIVWSDPATLVRSLRRGCARLSLSVDAGTRNTTSRRPPKQTVDTELAELTLLAKVNKTVYKSC